MFITVGDYGVIATSTNGSLWTLQQSGTEGHLSSVAAGNGVFVAAQNNGSHTVSSNGVNWRLLKSPGDIQRLTFEEGVFLASVYPGTGSDFAIFSSVDGSSWTRRGTVPGTPNQIIRAADGYWAAGYGKVYGSPDLETWTIQATNLAWLYSLAWNQGRFAAVGSFDGLSISGDGMTWTNALPAGLGAFNKIIYADGKFVAVGSGRFATSPDGIEWTAGGMPHPPNINIVYNGIAYGNGIFVACGSRGYVASSINGTDWTSHFKGTIESLGCVTYSGSEWWAAGHLQELVASTNGIDWEVRRNQLPGGIADILQTNGVMVAAYGLGGVKVSTNGGPWEEHMLSDRESPFGVNYGHGRWVVAGSGGLLATSDDASAWVPRASGTTRGLYSVSFGASQFVVVGDDGVILTSSNGLAWVARDAGIATHLNAVTYGNGIFLTVGDSGTTLISSNGMGWAVRYCGWPVILTDVAYGYGHFVAVGLSGEILSSTNGIEWALRDSPTSFPLFSVAAGDRSFIAVGLGGVIVQSDPLVSLVMSPDSGSTLKIYGPRHIRATVQRKSLFHAESTWEDAASLWLRNEPQEWADTALDSSTSRLYRVIVEP